MNIDLGGGKIFLLEIVVKLGLDVILLCDVVDVDWLLDFLEWWKNGLKSLIFMKFMSFKFYIDLCYFCCVYMINIFVILFLGVKDIDVGIYWCRMM